MAQEIETEESTVDPKFAKGFNDGYLLAKHEPELAKMLAANNNEHNIYFQACKAGIKEHGAEVLAWSKSFSKGKAVKGDRGIDKDR